MISPMVKSVFTAALGAALFFLLCLPLTYRVMSKAIPKMTEANGSPSLIGVAVQTSIFFGMALLILLSLDRFKKN